jgi:hypothetical protein
VPSLSRRRQLASRTATFTRRPGAVIIAEPAWSGLLGPQGGCGMTNKRMGEEGLNKKMDEEGVYKRSASEDDVEGHMIGTMNPALARDLARAKEADIRRATSRNNLVNETKKSDPRRG